MLFRRRYPRTYLHEKPFMRFVWIGVKNPLLIDRCRHGSVYHNNGLWQLEINRRLIFWRGNSRRSGVVREGTNYKLNCRDHFYLKDVVGGIGIMLLKFRLLCSPDIFWKPCLVKPKSMKKRKSRGLHCQHLYLRLTLSLWKFGNRVRSTTISCD